MRASLNSQRVAWAAWLADSPSGVRLRPGRLERRLTIPPTSVIQISPLTVASIARVPSVRKRLTSR